MRRQESVQKPADGDGQQPHGCRRISFGHRCKSLAVPRAPPGNPPHPARTKPGEKPGFVA